MKILIYSRGQNKQVSDSIDLICKELSHVGLQTEQTYSTNLARLVLNSDQVVHFFIEQLPMTLNELIFMSFAKTLGRATVLSIFNSALVKSSLSRPFFDLFCPDALSVSQTNYLQFYRNWNCSKMLLPLIPRLAPLQKNKKDLTHRPFLIPLAKKLDEAFEFKTEQDIYFDARKLLKNFKSSTLRKQWSHFLQNKKIKTNDHLILSDDKIKHLIEDESLQIVLARPSLEHTEFSNWLSLALNKQHWLILNEHQATGFSQAWTSGLNAHVVSSQNWTKTFATENLQTSSLTSHFKLFQLTELHANELSRLYTKILHQKTSLLSADSAKIKS